MSLPLNVSTPVLQLDDLAVRQGARTLLSGLSLRLHAGRTLCLVGESGSGKSLTALSVMGLLPEGLASSGRMSLAGQDLRATWPQSRGRDLGMVFQEPMTALNPLMGIGEQVAEAVRLHEGVSAAVALERARAVLARVGLPHGPHDLARRPHELSGGQRQRVAIAIAIVLKPRVLIADEPTTALDVSTQHQILQLLRELVAEQGCALLLVTHDLAVVAQMADEVVVLRRGEVIEQGPLPDVFERPAQAYTRTLLAHARLAGWPRPRPVAPSAPAALLEVQGLTRSHLRRRHWWRADERHVAVREVSLQVGAGERVGLVGESGCGKSTLLRSILGLASPQAGEVRLAGQRFTGQQIEGRRRIQMVFQDPHGSFDPRWRVEQIVAEPLHLLPGPWPRAERRARVIEVLQQVGLQAQDADRLPHQFSGGQRQRIALARALITQPDLLVLDEAVSALDVTVRAQVLELLHDLSERTGLAYLFVSHDLGVVQAVTDRVYVMSAGSIVEQGPTAEVFARPQHPYTAALVAATPDLDRALAARHTGLQRSQA